jgi:hypothetical protein
MKVATDFGKSELHYIIADLVQYFITNGEDSLTG